MTTMRAIVRVTFTYLVYCVVSVSSVQASAPMPGGSLYDDISGRLVTSFDSKGMATVSAEYTIYNYRKDALNDLTLTIPGKDVRVLRAVLWQGTDRQVTCDATDPSNGCSPYFKPYTTTDYAYVIASPEVNAGTDETTVKVPFETPLQSMKNMSVYLTYKADGFVTEKSGGLREYVFKSPKLAVPVGVLDVAVSVDPNMYLAGQGMGVVETSNDGGDLSTEIASVSTGSVIGNDLNLASHFNQAINNSSGTVVKRATNLDPNESFTVSGRYAQSWWRLNVALLGWLGLGMAALILLIVFGERLASRRIGKATK